MSIVTRGGNGNLPTTSDHTAKVVGMVAVVLILAIAITLI